MKPQAQPGTAAAAAAELRELISEGRGMIKDLNGILRQVRESIDAGARAAEEAAHKAAAAEMDRAFKHIQDQINQQGASLNAGIDRARQHIVDSLAISRLQPRPDGKYDVVFEAAGRFDDKAEVRRR